MASYVLVTKSFPQCKDQVLKAQRELQRVFTWEYLDIFLISNFRRVMNVVCFLLGNSLESEFYIPTFRNTLSVPSSYAGRFFIPTFLWRWNRVFRNVNIWNSDAGELPRRKYTSWYLFFKADEMMTNIAPINCKRISFMKPVFSVAYGIVVLCDCPRKLLTHLK
jgi:hypothetical protein